MKIPNNYVAKFRCYGCGIKIRERDFDKKILNEELVTVFVDGHFKTLHKLCFDELKDKHQFKVVKPKFTIEALLKYKSNVPIGIIGERSEVLDIKMIKENNTISWEELKNGGSIFIPFGSITENSFKLLLSDVSKKYNVEFKYVTHFDKKVYEVACCNKRWFK